jgi:hypothetical protein
VLEREAEMGTMNRAELLSVSEAIGAQAAGDASLSQAAGSLRARCERLLGQ